MAIREQIIDDIKSRIDCRTLIAEDIGEPRHRSARRWMYACPLHHESKGQSFVVSAEGWKCFGKCNEGGDCISWLQRWHGMTFTEAAAHLGQRVGIDTGTYAPPIRHIDRRARQQAAAAEPTPPSLDWQIPASALVQRAESYLWSAAGAGALAYLKLKRGLFESVIREARLGLIPNEVVNSRNGCGWFDGIGAVYPGITIPRMIGGELWAVNVRRSPTNVEAFGGDKYKMFQGSKVIGSLYWADRLRPGHPVLFTEGEFDCLIAWQCLDLYPVSLGSANNPLHERWLPALANAPTILSLMDNDAAGHIAAQRLGAISKRVKSITVPTGKDLTDLYAAQSCAGVVEFVEGEL